MRRALLASLLASLAGCSSGPPIGQCTGTLNGQAFDASIDLVSQHHDVRRRTCAEQDLQKRWHFSYGNGALVIDALSLRNPKTASQLGKDQTLALPPEPGAYFQEWTVLAPSGASLLGGTMTVTGRTMNLSDRLDGTFTMDLAEGTVECAFELPQGPADGKSMSCPGDSDDDDWDD